MRVLMTGGGTAGHINPALAIAETIRKNDPSAVIEFVGVRNNYKFVFYVYESISVS